MELSLPVSSSRSPCREESVSSEDTWLFQFIFPIQEALVHTMIGPDDIDGYTFCMLRLVGQACQTAES